MTQYINNMKKPASPYKATKLWNQLLSSFKEGMILKKKRWRLKTYEQCFSGAEALNWMHAYLQNSPAFDANVTRKQAFLLLQKFLENNIFESVLGKSYRQFQDTNFLYQFVVNDTAGSEKVDKENIVMQNSIPNVLKYFGRKNSCSTSCENLNFLDNKSSELSKQKKKFQQEASSTTRKPLTEINIMKTYSNMSTFLFDESDEESCDVFNSSISQSNFMRSSSLRFSKKSKKMPFSLKKNDDIDEERLVEAKEIVKKSCTSKQLKTKELLMSSSSMTSSNFSRMSKADSQDTLCSVSSPSKKVKIDDEKSSLPRTRQGKSLHKNILDKAVPSEHQYSIALLDSKNDITNLPGYKSENSSKMLNKKIATELLKPPRIGVKRHLNEDKKEKFQIKKLSDCTTKSLESESSNSILKSPSNTIQASIESPKKQNKKLRRTIRKSLSQNDLNNFRNTKIPVSSLKDQINQSESLKISVLSLKDHTNQSEPLRRKRCESVISDYSNSVLNSKKISLKNVLHKAQSVWSLNEIGTNKENVTNEIGHDEPLPLDIENTWKSVVLLSLRKLLQVEKLSGYLDENSISGGSIIRNVEAKNDTKDTPAWLLSALSCLINWPESYENLKDNQTTFKNHEELERDIFQTIKEYYEKNLTEPLFPYHFFGLLQECEAMLHADPKAVIKILQHTLLLLPNWNRCQLYLIVNFMKKASCNDTLCLNADIANKDLILHSFYHLIARKEKQSMNKMYEDVVSMRITNFLMEHYEEIFMLPTGLRVQVDHKIAVTFGAKKCNNALSSINIVNKKHCKNNLINPIKRTPSFCARISMQQYEKEAAELSRKALHDLLLSIINNKNISEKDKTKQLKKFEKTYPEIYTEYNRRKALLPKTGSSSSQP
ncbi:DEP domain-containing protein 1A isoform X1 [Hydra vulgaris]|uniref:DEP domain-containing protein 1A isoform X1 n=2 Tax=Hydra vulgaris TaxID=6087 RepID=UPI0006415D61|nr:DEP domain-containing protein 1A isoform X1 [Hydra vulgaris]